MVRGLALLTVLAFAGCGSCYNTESVRLSQDDSGRTGADVAVDTGLDASIDVSTDGPALDFAADVAADLTSLDMADGGDACIELSVGELCAIAGPVCGQLTVVDNCGAMRPIDCRPCGANATCEQNACTCGTGYELVGVNCVDLDECTLGTHDCTPMEFCINEPGAFSCANCPMGYRDADNDGVCEDIDECAEGIDACDALVTCANSTGSYVCGACPAGYMDTNGDGTLCEDVDECAGANNCAAVATSTNQIPGFMCACPAGYTDPQGNGTVCNDIDECAAATDMCDANATCQNTPGAYSCMCNNGFVGNGFTCSAGSACPDGFCDVAGGESYETCAADCRSATAIAVGEEHSCALLVDRSVRCWGENIEGELGDGTGLNSAVPVKVLLPMGAVMIGASHDDTCARLTDGSLWCWGDGNEGELGNNTSADSLVPVQVIGLTNVDGFDGGNDAVCAWQTGAGAWCWGSSFHGRLGNGLMSGNQRTPQPVSLAAPVRQLSFGHAHACVTSTQGQLSCWGRNTNGQIGDGTMMHVASPVVVALGTPADRVGLGDDHTCVVIAGALRCWGLNDEGQLGDGNTLTFSPTPIVVPGVSDAVDVDGGSHFTCIRRAGGALRCWGEGDEGQLGNGTGANSTAHVNVTGLSDVVQHLCGNDHTCALRATGDVVCWGQGDQGQIGNGGFMDVSTPTPVSPW